MCRICTLRDVPFEFHHRDPCVKLFYISREAGNVSMSRLREEVLKCDLVCAVCHQELHRLASVAKGTYIEALDEEDLSEAFASLADGWRA